MKEVDLIDDYGVDPVRYYLMREMVLGQDANFTVKSFINRYNSDLANDLGNLLSRISTLIQKNYNDLSKIKIGKRIFITIDASQSKELIHEEIIRNLKKWKLIK